MNKRHYPETYLLSWDRSLAPEAEVVRALPERGPEGFPWEKTLSGRLACRWENSERDLERVSRRFPGVTFTLRIRCARHQEHAWTQFHRDGRYREEPGFRAESRPDPAACPA